MSEIGTTAPTNHLLARPQSKYGRVHFTGPGNSSAPSKCQACENVIRGKTYMYMFKAQYTNQYVIWHKQKMGPTGYRNQSGV
jgi:hypothetical protein